jgi:hypothetical protein
MGHSRPLPQPHLVQFWSVPCARGRGVLGIPTDIVQNIVQPYRMPFSLWHSILCNLSNLFARGERCFSISLHDLGQTPHDTTVSHLRIPIESLLLSRCRCLGTWNPTGSPQFIDALDSIRDIECGERRPELSHLIPKIILPTTGMRSMPS